MRLGSKFVCCITDYGLHRSSYCSYLRKPFLSSDKTKKPNRNKKTSSLLLEHKRKRCPTASGVLPRRVDTVTCQPRCNPSSSFHLLSANEKPKSPQLLERASQLHTLQDTHKHTCTHTQSCIFMVSLELKLLLCLVSFLLKP